MGEFIVRGMLDLNGFIFIIGKHLRKVEIINNDVIK